MTALLVSCIRLACTCCAAVFGPAGIHATPAAAGDRSDLDVMWMRRGL